MPNPTDDLPAVLAAMSLHEVVELTTRLTIEKSMAVFDGLPSPEIDRQLAAIDVDWKRRKQAGELHYGNVDGIIDPFLSSWRKCQ